MQREFEGIASQFQDHENARLILKYDESLSHSIYAASDIFVIPSIFEPCGLTQVRLYLALHCNDHGLFSVLEHNIFLLILFLGFLGKDVSTGILN